MYALVLLNFIVPFVMVLVGYLLKKYPVKDMGSQNGYNTPASRKSQEHWDYAQGIAPGIFMGMGKWSGIAELMLTIFLFAGKAPVGCFLAAGSALGFSCLILAFYKTETRIKEKFVV